VVIEQCGQRYRQRMADVSEKFVSRITSINADFIILSSSQVEKIDTVARRIFRRTKGTPTEVVAKVSN
jgi:hypothetical protein